jgi:hypothetical protein
VASPTEKVPKSAWSRGDRPTEEHHHATIAVSTPPVLGFDGVGRIRVVDDVITRWRDPQHLRPPMGGGLSVGGDRGGPCY